MKLRICYYGESRVYAQCTLKDKRRTVDLYSLLGVRSAADVVRRGRLRWFGHLERKSMDNWVLVCRNVVLAGVGCVDRGRNTWGECVKDDMKLLRLQPEWAIFRDLRRVSIYLFFIYSFHQRSTCIIQRIEMSMFYCLGTQLIDTNR